MNKTDKFLYSGFAVVALAGIVAMLVSVFSPTQPPQKQEEEETAEQEIAPENGLGNNWIPLGIAVVCIAVTYTHTQQSDDDFLVDDGQMSTQADGYKNARSIKAQMLDNLTDEELALYCALTGQTAEQLDKEEAEFKKALLSSQKSLKIMWKTFPPHREHALDDSAI